MLRSSSNPGRALRPDLGFRRPAVVLSGGGAMAAYEVGVLRVVEAVGLKPAIIAGVSAGAVNAVLWAVHGGRSAPLVRVWENLRPESVGMRWSTLLLRTLGLFLFILAGLQIILTIGGSQEFSLFRGWTPAVSERSEWLSALLDVLAWLVVAVLGVAAAAFSAQAEAWMARLTPPLDPLRIQRWFGRLLLLGAAIHLVTWGLALPWPHRFSATLLLAGTVLWMGHRPGRAGDWLRSLFHSILPETGGRGLWSGAARRKLLKRLVSEGDPSRLFDPDLHLIMSALALDGGRMGYFVNWVEISAEFRARIEQNVGEVIPVRTPAEIVEAAVASSAIPGVYEPVRIGDRDFVDGGVFSNQPLHAALADGADALLVVLVSPSSGPSRPQRDLNLVELVGRLIELANWRDLQTEMRALPPGWTAAGPRPGAEDLAPAPVCVVEPRSALAGGLYGFAPDHARLLMALGEQDAWSALERAGWLAPKGTSPAGSPA